MWSTRARRREERGRGLKRVGVETREGDWQRAGGGGVTTRASYIVCLCGSLSCALSCFFRVSAELCDSSTWSVSCSANSDATLTLWRTTLLLLLLLLLFYLLFCIIYVAPAPAAKEEREREKVNFLMSLAWIWQKEFRLHAGMGIYCICKSIYNGINL